MLGLLLIYFVGKYFYELAHEHDRSRWGFAILGVVVYYVSQLMLGTILVSTLVLSGMEMTPGTQLLMNVIAIACGVAGIWLFYFLLLPAQARMGKEPEKSSF